MRINLLLFFLTLVIFSCGNQPEQEQPLNPNGDSELALLMRQMRDDGFLIKADLENGKEINTILKHETLLTAEATEPEKAETPVYKAFATAHIELMNALNDPDHTDKRIIYNNMINNCIQCHKVLCPGPIAVIKKMALKSP